MRTKLLSALLLASTAIAGVASADPIVRDHRNDRNDRYSQHDRDGRDRNRPAPQYSWSGGVHVTTRPSWMPQVNYGSQVTYGYQVDADGDEVRPYTYGNDPYVEGIARGEWSLVGDNLWFDGNQNHGQIMDLGGRPLRSIELQSESGCPQIVKVAVLLRNGSSIALNPQRSLDSRSPNLRIDLGPAASVGVNRIIVYGTGSGTFRMLGA